MAIAEGEYELKANGEGLSEFDNAKALRMIRSAVKMLKHAEIEVKVSEAELAAAEEFIAGIRANRTRGLIGNRSPRASSRDRNV